MTQLTLEAAHALLGDAYGIAADEPLIACRVNFFESAVLALPPGAVGLVRQDMLGRRHTHLFPVELLDDLAVKAPRRRQRALRFAVEGVVWQFDRVAEADWDNLVLHVSRAPAGLATEDDIEELDLEPDPAEEPAAPPPVPAPRATPTDAGTPATAALFQSAGGAPGAAGEDEHPLTPMFGAEAVAAPAPPPPVTAEPRRTPVDELLDFFDVAVETDPTPDGLAPLLRKIFHQSQALGQTDRALLTAQALLALGKAGPLERQLAERYQSSRVLEAEGTLTPAHWDALRELPAPDRALMEVTTALAPALTRMTARSPRDYGLKGAPEGASQLMFGRVFDYARRVLALPAVRYHPHPDGPKGIAFANLTLEDGWMSALVVGADYLSGRSELELAYRIGHELAFLRHEHLLRVITPTLAQQAVLVLTAVAMAVPDQPIAGDQEQAIKSQLSHVSKYMELEDFERVSVAVRHLLSQTEPFDLTRWNRAVERSALRAGTLLTGDVQVAAKAAAEGITATAEALRVRAEILRFAVSNLHGQLRRDLQLAVA